MLVSVVDVKLTGRNIASLRAVRGISVKDLQEMLGIATPQAIYKWQHGAAIPTIDNLIVLSATFGVRIDDIIVVENRRAVS